MTPRQAVKLDDIITLESDNWSVKSGWILLDDGVVHLTNQHNGQESTGSVTFDRRSFNALIDWYHRHQKVTKRKK